MNIHKSKNSLPNTFLMVLIAITFVFSCNATQAQDYSNNIGFMKNPPKELKDKFPMCDQFLDVKWIRQFPNGGWVGTVTADVYMGSRWEQREQSGPKKQRELVVMQRNDQGGSYMYKDELYAYDVSESAIKGNELELLIKSANYAYSTFLIGSGNNSKRGFAVKIDGKLTEISKARGYPGSGKGNYTQFSQNVCVILPNKENGWMIENKSGGYGHEYLKSNTSQGGDKNGK